MEAAAERLPVIELVPPPDAIPASVTVGVLVVTGTPVPFRSIPSPELPWITFSRMTTPAPSATMPDPELSLITLPRPEAVPPMVVLMTVESL